MKMNVSMSMDFLNPIKNFFKKYTALLPSIAIVVAALLLFVPTMLIGKSVKKEMQVSKGHANQVSSLLQNVPSRNAPQQVKRFMDRLEEEANQIEMLAVESSMRELVSYDVFPPKGTSAQLYISFGRQYRNRIEALLSLMNALDAPNDAEIRSQTGAGTRATTQFDEMGPRGMTRSRGAATAATNPMIEALCLKRAQEISVYANPSTFPWYEFWERYEFGGQQQALVDCWDSQVTLWISEDIAQTISTMNAGSTQVSTSPVKRLLGVSFSAPIDSGTSTDVYTRGRTTTSRDKPNYIISSAAAGTGTPGMAGTAAPARQSNFVPAALTGRAGDEDVDVIHFAFSVLVDNRYVMAFMKELCSEKQHTYREGFQENGQEKTAIHNQITILDSDITAVEKQAPEHELYRYGNGAVMRLDLVCEYQFYRKGYDAIKPEPVKQALGQSEIQDTASPTPDGPYDMGRRDMMGPRGNAPR